MYYVILEKSLNDKHFKIERADDCVWLTDKRGKDLVVHLVPKQAKKIGKELIRISKAKPGAEMAGFSGASFGDNTGTVGREGYPPQPFLNYPVRNKKSKKRTPLQGGGSGWVMG